MPEPFFGTSPHFKMGDCPAPANPFSCCKGFSCPCWRVGNAGGLPTGFRPQKSFFSNPGLSYLLVSQSANAQRLHQQRRKAHVFFRHLKIAERHSAGFAERSCAFSHM